MQPNINTLQGLSFDSSLANIDAAVSSTEYEERLLFLLQPILDERFPNNRGKQTIRVHKDRINFACPTCGDSMKSNYKKRGNFILRGKYSGFFKCHNCGEMKRIDHFFRDYKINLDLGIINYIAQSIQDFSNTTDAKYDMSLFMDIDSIEKYAIDRQEFLNYFRLEEVKESSVWPWLKNRLQYDTSKFMYNPRLNHVIVLNLTQAGKILGIQKRTFKKTSSKYLTYTLQHIYELMKKDPKIIPDEISMLSQLFNICLINYTKPVTLFEGPLDSFLFKNSIAGAGAHKQFSLDLNVRFFYDYDKTGKDKSIEKISHGEYIFLWGKFLKDTNAPYRLKWDLNDILIWAKENNIKLPNFENYFSNDSLDLIDF